ncbi:MAG: pilus assembly protein PilM [Sedimentisphaerales bacterium]|nr:pilus assembly protein PilM [Sedimentisphaerales bacterium]
MKFAAKTALGIDISDGTINMALLGQSTKGIELLKTACAPVPEDAVKDGNIENPAKLARAIKELKTRNKIKAGQAAISLFTKPVVLQIFEMPKGGHTGAGQFIRNELKSYVLLSGLEFASDFCRVSSTQERKCRLLAAATDCQNVNTIAQTTDMAGLNVRAIEPPLLSYARALYAKKIEGKFDSDVLIVILHCGLLSLCVFRKQMLEFVRIENISEQQDLPEQISRWLPEKINEIIRSYDVETADSSGNWEVTIVVDSVELPQNLEQTLRTGINCENVQIRNRKNVCRETVVANIDDHENASVVAIGLAMGVLNQNDNGLKINLVPPESAEVRAVKKQLIITTTIISAMPLFMVLTGIWFSTTANNVKRDIIKKKQAEITVATYSLLKEQESLNKQIKLLFERPEQLSSILGFRQTIDWVNMLEDIRKRTPKTVRIINLYSKENTGMYLEGLATSYESIHLFVEMLNRSNYINSASLNETTKEEEKENGLITYTIDCSLKLQKEKS